MSRTPPARPYPRTISSPDCADPPVRPAGKTHLQVLTEHEEKNSVAIASDESFGGLDQDLHRPPPLRGVVDRLTFNGTIIETGTDSYRLASTRARTEEPAKAG